MTISDHPHRGAKGEHTPYILSHIPQCGNQKAVMAGNNGIDEETMEHQEATTTRGMMPRQSEGIP